MESPLGSGATVILAHIGFVYLMSESVENLQDAFSKSHYAGAAYNVCLLCSEEGMVEGGRHSSLKTFLHLQREPNLKSGHILVIIRILRNRRIEDCSRICRSCKKKVVARGSNTSNLRAHHPTERMQGKLTLSSGA